MLGNSLLLAWGFNRLFIETDLPCRFILSKDAAHSFLVVYIAVRPAAPLELHRVIESHEDQYVRSSRCKHLASVRATGGRQDLLYSAIYCFFSERTLRNNRSSATPGSLHRLLRKSDGRASRPIV